MESSIPITKTNSADTKAKTASSENTESKEEIVQKNTEINNPNNDKNNNENNNENNNQINNKNNDQINDENNNNLNNTKSTQKLNNSEEKQKENNKNKTIKLTLNSPHLGADTSTPQAVMKALNNITSSTYNRYPETHKNYLNQTPMIQRNSRSLRSSRSSRNSMSTKNSINSGFNVFGHRQFNVVQRNRIVNSSGSSSGIGIGTVMKSRMTIGLPVRNTTSLRGVNRNHVQIGYQNNNTNFGVGAHSVNNMNNTTNNTMNNTTNNTTNKMNNNKNVVKTTNSLKRMQYSNFSQPLVLTKLHTCNFDNSGPSGNTSTFPSLSSSSSGILKSITNHNNVYKQRKNTIKPFYSHTKNYYSPRANYAPKSQTQKFPVTGVYRPMMVSNFNYGMPPLRYYPTPPRGPFTYRGQYKAVPRLPNSRVGPGRMKKVKQKPERKRAKLNKRNRRQKRVKTEIDEADQEFSLINQKERSWGTGTVSTRQTQNSDWHFTEELEIYPCNEKYVVEERYGLYSQKPEKEGDTNRWTIVSTTDLRSKAAADAHQLIAEQWDETIVGGLEPVIERRLSRKAAGYSSLANPAGEVLVAAHWNFWEVNTAILCMCIKFMVCRMVTSKQVSMRRKRCGSLLAAHLVDLALSRKKVQWVLVCSEGGYPERFWKTLGFEEIPRRERARFSVVSEAELNPFRDTVLMRLTRAQVHSGAGYSKTATMFDSWKVKHDKSERVIVLKAGGKKILDIKLPLY